MSDHDVACGLAELADAIAREAWSAIVYGPGAPDRRLRTDEVWRRNRWGVRSPFRRPRRAA